MINFEKDLKKSNKKDITVKNKNVVSLIEPIMKKDLKE